MFLRKSHLAQMLNVLLNGGMFNKLGPTLLPEKKMCDRLKHLWQDIKGVDPFSVRPC